MSTTVSNDSPMLYERGRIVAHSSDEDGGPDVGESIGLGGKMLYVGERPGQRAGWSICIYPEAGDAIDIADGVDPDRARDLIAEISTVLSA